MTWVRVFQNFGQLGIFFVDRFVMQSLLLAPVGTFRALTRIRSAYAMERCSTHNLGNQQPRRHDVYLEKLESKAWAVLVSASDRRDGRYNSSASAGSLRLDLWHSTRSVWSSRAKRDSGRY